MPVVNIREAKTTLSQLILPAERGQVVIARNGVPVVRLVPVQPALPREAGAWRSQPGWEQFCDDPAVLAPMSETEMQAEGWP